MVKSLLLIKVETDEVTGPNKLWPDVSKSESPIESVTPPVPSSYFKLLIMVPNPAIALKLEGLTCPLVRSTSYLIKDSLASSAFEITAL